MKTFVSELFLNSPTFSQCTIKSKILVHMRILASGYKNAVSMLYMLGLVIFQNHAHIQNFERSLSECTHTEMSKSAM